MDDLDLPISSSTAERQPPLPVVVTLESDAAASSAALLSFTIPLHTPQGAPSWHDLLGQR